MEAEQEKSAKTIQWRELGILGKLQYIWNNMTVEPLLALYIMPSILSALATQNLNLEKACRVNLAYGDEICDALSRRDTANYTQEEQVVQQIVAKMAGWKTILQSALPCLLILFWGSWSDRHGRRKPCMLIPIVGELLSALGLILCTYFEWLPMEASGITEALFPGLTGGWFTQMMGVFSYIADITDEENRTLRVGIVHLCVSLGFPLGMALSGILLKVVGFYGIFSISSAMYSIGLLYGIFCVKEPKKDIKPPKNAGKNALMDFFDKAHVKETFTVAFSGRNRIRVLMLIVVVMVVIGPMHGEMSVFYLFTRYRFNWSEVEFSFFSTYSMITHFIGTSFSVGVFSRLLMLDDALIGVISCMSKILSSFMYAFAVTEWQLYLAPIIEFLNGTSFIAMRSIASKLVSTSELGKLNSLIGVAEALMPLVYAPMYTNVYAATMKSFPGAFFVLGGVLTLPAVFIFCFMYKLHKNDKIQSANEKPENGQTSIADNANGKTYLSYDNPGFMKEKSIDIVRVEHLEQSRL
ncbi:probable peptidoglycan muropeptide transporter SLC46 [Phlebotomus argentipes]|uniref:probable peptidoglycan muropeptide transporter SLC46 n=1 Tax=Phlebotomus argentipes TaxID=94469 RepID=UPI00289322E6|nr:probable peptidoglycan muropeptide transporter SLC46 [Phlebotomus argentipes]XP_059608437.1 probable peptidoglycan muropeptide transporter SLC46 [Phlebotomus argentipes]